MNDLKTAALAATVDEYMPTDEEWAANPWATASAADGDGTVYMYSSIPRKGDVFWWETGAPSALLKNVTPPANFRTTLRMRPEGI